MTKTSTGKFLLLLLLSAFVLLLIFSSCSPAMGRQKWEYKVVEVVTGSDFVSRQQAQLNELGIDGWDCSTYGPSWDFLCKRPK